MGWVLLFHFLMMVVGAAQAEDVVPPDAGVARTRHTLKELRDRYVVKQQLDYSCGAAALSTLMTYYFGDKTPEKETLQRLSAVLTNLSEEQLARKKLIGFSLLDLKIVAQQKGYQAAGFKLTLDQLRQLVAPVIVYVHPFGYHHFAVLRGIAGDRVFLADPARGNLRMSLSRFANEYGGVVFVLGKAGEENIKTYPLALARPSDYPETSLRGMAHRGNRMANFTVDRVERSKLR
jgi:predicted double-glycine peptidase